MTPEHQRHIQDYIQNNLMTDESIIIAQERDALFSSLSKYLNHGIESKNAFLSCYETILNVTIEISTLNGELLKLKRESYTINLPRLLRPWKRFKLGRVHIKYLFTRALI